MNKAIDSQNAIHTVLNANSLAIVGVSSNPAKLGGMIMETLINGGYTGRVYPVNRGGGEISGHKVYTNVLDIPDSLDAVVIIVAAELVSGVIRDAASKGAKGAIILSAGFREFGRKDLEEEILSVAREHGIRLMGPNIQGITYLPNHMCAMFFPVLRERGPLSIITHSGSITGSLADWAERDKLGITAAVNLGNQVDLCESDYLDYFADDPETGAIVCYLEGIKDGKQFLRALRRAAARKPVVILKSGHSESGAKAAASHTGSLAGSHAVFTGICRQHGAVSVSGITELYDAAKALALITSPRGNRLVVLSSSGGAATLVADEIDANGLTLPPLPDEAINELEQLDLNPMTHIDNPFDSPIVVAEPYLQVARIIDKYDAADTILFCFADAVSNVDLAFAAALADLRTSVAICYMGGGDLELSATPVLSKAGIAVFPSPERAIRSIGHATWRSHYLSKRGLELESRNA